MFSPGFVLHSANNYGVVKTQTIFGFGSDKNLDQNGLISSKPLEMFFEERNFGRSFKDLKESSQKNLKKSRNGNTDKFIERKNRKRHLKHKVKKCFYKLLKGKKKKYKFLKKKFLLPLLIGFMTIKILLVPLALKAMAFVLFNGLLIGFVSATMLSLRGILSHSYEYHHRRNDGYKEIENIYVPSQVKDAYKKHYQRNDSKKYTNIKQEDGVPKS